MLAAAGGLGAAAGQGWRAGDAEDQVLVLWKASPTQADLDAEAARLRRPAGRPLALLRGDLDQAAGARTLRDTALIGLHHVRLAAPGPAAVDAALAAYRASALVASAEADPPLHAASACELSAPGPVYQQGLQWDLTATAWPQADQAYCGGAIQLQGQVTVAVLDTGIDAAQSDFPAGRPPVAGANYSSDADANDDNGHGTFCAGLIGAVPGDLSGAFFDWNYLNLLSVKVLNSCGEGDMGGLAEGIVYAVQQHAQVISMSVQGPQGSDALQAAVVAAWQAGAVLVAAAGNDAGPAAYPAAYPNVLSVAALDHLDRAAYYSNRGKIDLSAPGGDGAEAGCSSPPLGAPPFCQGVQASYPAACGGQMWSLAASYNPVLSSQCASPGDGHYGCGGTGAATGSGTSFAAPLVAAAAALLVSQDPSRSNQDVLQRLLQSAAPTAEGAGFHSDTGWGKLDFDQALEPGFHAVATVKQPGIYNYPNPFHPGSDGLTTFSLQLTGDGPARLDLFDAAGQLVRHWDLAGRSGMQLQAWDGHNGRGQLVGNGGYRAVLTQGGARAVAKVAVLQ